MKQERVYTAYAVDPADKDKVIDCGDYATVEEAKAAVAAEGYELAEVETVYL
jgi:hypothetical protein